jgi:hypothetical protein
MTLRPIAIAKPLIIMTSGRSSGRRVHVVG